MVLPQTQRHSSFVSTSKKGATMEASNVSTKKWVVGGTALSFGLVALLVFKGNNVSDGTKVNSQVQFAVKSDEELTSSSSTAPHIFLFTVDDMGWNDIGYNSGDLPEATPFMKSLAHQGITLTHHDDG
jgi:hypothetical protein